MSGSPFKRNASQYSSNLRFFVHAFMFDLLSVRGGIKTSDGRTYYHLAALVKGSDMEFESMVTIIHSRLQRWYILIS